MVSCITTTYQILYSIIFATNSPLYLSLFTNLNLPPIFQNNTNYIILYVDSLRKLAWPKLVSTLDYYNNQNNLGRIANVANKKSSSSAAVSSPTAV